MLDRWAGGGSQNEYVRYLQCMHACLIVRHACIHVRSWHGIIFLSLIYTYVLMHQNLPSGLSEDGLRQLFSPYGEVVMSRALHQGDSIVQGGAALVRMASMQEATRAVQALQGQKLYGALHPLVVRFADSAEIKAKKQAKLTTSVILSPGSTVASSPEQQQRHPIQHRHQTSPTLSTRASHHRVNTSPASGNSYTTQPLTSSLSTQPISSHQPPRHTAPPIFGQFNSSFTGIPTSSHMIPTQLYQHAGGFSSAHQQGLPSAYGGGGMTSATGTSNNDNYPQQMHAPSAGFHMGGPHQQQHQGPAAEMYYASSKMEALNSSGLRNMVAVTRIMGTQSPAGHAASQGSFGPAASVGGPAGGIASLYVKNLPPEADKLFLYERFAPFGAIVSVKVSVCTL